MKSSRRSATPTRASSGKSNGKSKSRSASTSEKARAAQPRAEAPPDTELPRPVRGSSIRERAREVYQEAIVEAAERIFIEHGFQRTRMSDIASEAGLATGTLYNYFKSKNQILGSLLVMRVRKFLGEIEAVLTQPLTGRDLLVAMVRASLANLENHRTTFIMLAQTGVQSEGEVEALCGPEHRELFDGFQGMFARALAAAQSDLVRDDVTPADLAIFLTGAMNGWVRNWVLSGASLPLSSRAEFIVDLFLGGAGKHQ